MAEQDRTVSDWCRSTCYRLTIQMTQSRQETSLQRQEKWMYRKNRQLYCHLTYRH